MTLLLHCTKSASSSLVLQAFSTPSESLADEADNDKKFGEVEEIKAPAITRHFTVPTSPARPRRLNE